MPLSAVFPDLLYIFFWDDQPDVYTVLYPSAVRVWTHGCYHINRSIYLKHILMRLWNMRYSSILICLFKAYRWSLSEEEKTCSYMILIALQCIIHLVNTFADEFSPFFSSPRLPRCPQISSVVNLLLFTNQLWHQW